MILIALTLVIVGFLLWAVNSIIPIDDKIKKIINAVVILFTCVWLLSVFGLIKDFPIPKW